MDKYPQLQIKNQLCFPLYACSKELVRRYTPFLEPLELTYTQYLVMMVLWEHENINIKEVGKILWLDSGTLTPVIKKLETKGFLERCRRSDDERCVMVSLTQKGSRLAEKAKDVPLALSNCVKLSREEAFEFYKLLNKVLDGFNPAP